MNDFYVNTGASSSFQQPQWYDNGSQYQQQMPYNQAPMSSAAQYGSFEDEAPLLEGKKVLYIPISGPPSTAAVATFHSQITRAASASSSHLHHSLPCPPLLPLQSLESISQLY